MLLARLDLRAFGKFTDVSLDLSARDRNFHLIYGPNEAGKSTSLRAIASLLFGMESNTDDCFQHRPTDIRVGGVLFDVNSGNRLECVRRRGRKQTL
ncbi:MAG: AAA family ATPase, partial [Rubripirellula sp.]|nr:AAA family ATPase [Rubripirellula sp.]